MTEPVYLDYAATTPVRPEILEAMLPYLGRETFGNPSSPHRFGRAARAGMESARRDIAQAVGAEPSQVIFTSGGTEADNMAIVGSVLAARAQGKPACVAVSAIEHKAILSAAHRVTQFGADEIILPVDGRGQLDLDALDRALERCPSVVSVMWVNNETGTLQPIEEIAGRCCDRGATFHTDAVQAFGKVPIDLQNLPCGLLTLSGHKIGAPKGIGALIIRDRRTVDSIIHGGGQQYGLRPGTENVAGAVALGRAAALVAQEWQTESDRIRRLRDRLLEALTAVIPDIVPHGASDAGQWGPHVLNVGIPQAEAEAVLMHLDLAGIAASGGSACNTGSVEPSHVLTAMGVPRDLALCSIRFSLGHETVESDIDRVVACMPDIVAKVRQLGSVLGRV